MLSVLIYSSIVVSLLLSKIGPRTWCEEEYSNQQNLDNLEQNLKKGTKSTKILIVTLNVQVVSEGMYI